MNEHLKNLINIIRENENDIYNSDTYFNNEITDSEGMLISHYVLGNVFAKGYINASRVNFEIYKNHNTWQVWVWQWDSEKKKENQFAAPYYKYDDVIAYLETL